MVDKCCNNGSIVVTLIVVMVNYRGYNGYNLIAT